MKSKDKNLNISYIGSYVQALPVKALKEEKSIDFVFTNEGVYALRNILNLKNLYEDKWKLINKINTSITIPIKISIKNKNQHSHLITSIRGNAPQNFEKTFHEYQKKN